MPSKLINLRVDEVSSVSRGAGHGVRVLLMKSDQQQKEEPPMSALDQDRQVAHDVVKNIRYLTDQGVPFAEAATQVFRFEKAGGYRATENGEGISSPKRRSDASHGEFEDATPTPQTYYSPSAADVDAPVEGSPAWEGEVKRLMQAHGVSRASAELILRARSSDAGHATAPTTAQKIAAIQKTQNLNWDQAATAVFRKMR